MLKTLLIFLIQRNNLPQAEITVVVHGSLVTCDDSCLINSLHVQTPLLWHHIPIHADPCNGPATQE